jgi:hypothetical protein
MSNNNTFLDILIGILSFKKQIYNFLKQVKKDGEISAYFFYSAEVVSFHQYFFTKTSIKFFFVYIRCIHDTS